MTKQKREQAGILAAVTGGFEVVTAHLWLVLIPVVLDVFYWIGPRLTAPTLILDLVRRVEEAGAMSEMSRQLAEVAPHTNLATALSVPYLGVPGLMAGFIMPSQTPVEPLALELRSPLQWLLWFGGLSVAGLLLAGIYYGLVARTVRMATATEDGVSERDWAGFLRRLPRYSLRMLGLAGSFIVALIALYLPLLCVATVAAFLSPTLVFLVTLVGLTLVLWLSFYLGFSVHGIMLCDRPVLWAMLDSVRLVQRYWLQALLLFVSVLATRNVLAWLWLWVDNGSWLTLVSIAGYAFINTALIAAMFIFYRDRVQTAEWRVGRHAEATG